MSSNKKRILLSLLFICAELCMPGSPAPTTDASTATTMMASGSSLALGSFSGFTASAATLSDLDFSTVSPTTASLDTIVSLDNTTSLDTTDIDQANTTTESLPDNSTITTGSVLSKRAALITDTIKNDSLHTKKKCVKFLAQVSEFVCGRSCAGTIGKSLYNPCRQGHIPDKEEFTKTCCPNLSDNSTTSPELSPPIERHCSTSLIPMYISMFCPSSNCPSDAKRELHAKCMAGILAEKQEIMEKCCPELLDDSEDLNEDDDQSDSSSEEEEDD